jgi:hypothetical protein
VEFEGGLSISVLKNKATRLEHLRLEIVQFLKMSVIFKARPVSHPAFFQLS